MTLHISCNIDSFTDNIHKKAMLNLGKFFGFKWQGKPPRIYVVENRKAMDELIGEKTKSWVVGWSNKGDIFVLDRNNYETESSEPYEERYYRGLIIHELTHVFCNAVTNNHYEPMWVSEGIARYLAGENLYKERPKKFSVFLKFFKSSCDNEVYYESGHAVQVLVEKYGKAKFIRLLKRFPETKTRLSFDKIFRKIYGFDASYSNFNGILN